jgi:threonylcarbamoyladenosine tRNA methylthiotransferase MtaB
VSDILSDLKRLEQLGYHEVVLAGTNLGSYGSDLGGSFGGLLEAIERLSPAMRVRLSSLDPNELNHDIVDLIADSSLFCPHIHLSLQALSDRVLKRMNRKYSVDFVVALLERLQQRVSRAGIGADLIAGFPGESREEVDQAVELFLELPISYLHVFPYSEREGTAATRLDASVPVAERQERARRWREVSQAKRHEFYSSLVGSTLDVIVENELGAGRFSGTSAEYAPVSVSKQSDAAVVDSFKPGARVKLKAERFVASEGRIECV